MNIKNSSNYLVCGSKSWNSKSYEQTINNFSDNWYFVDSKEKLTFEFTQKIQPRYIFFLHWSWKVPETIINNYECVCFHMTDVPYGRGGSPLQNLIIRGHQQTKLTALRMNEEFDAGPIYMKEDLYLSGNAEEIYIRVTELATRMIKCIVTNEPKPIPQNGEVVIFKRRKPPESEIPQLSSLSRLHDFIRMLDAQEYPKAFIKHQGFRYEFSRSALYDGRVIADVTITPIEEKDE